jgi:hypothetical protein
MEEHPEMVENVIILHINAIAHSADTVKNVLWHGGRKCYNILPLLLISVQTDAAIK